MHTLESDRQLQDSTRMSTTTQPRPAFGTVLADQMAMTTYHDGRWAPHEIRPTGPIEIHPAAHVLHYSSTCFEGFKAYRWADGSIHVFRMDKHIERMRQSARLLVLPEPDAAQLAKMIWRNAWRAGAGAAGRALRLLYGVNIGGPRALERGHPDRAREPGVGLFREGQAVRSREDQATARRSSGHGQDRRAAAWGHPRFATVQGRPGAVLPGRLGRRRAPPTSADPRWQDPCG
jgi:hypothetical protein